MGRGEKAANPMDRSESRMEVYHLKTQLLKINWGQNTRKMKKEGVILGVKILSNDGSYETVSQKPTDQ